MADFNQVLTPGDYQNGIVNTVVEIPQGSFLKIEWDRQRAAFRLDSRPPELPVVNRPRALLRTKCQHAQPCYCHKS